MTSVLVFSEFYLPGFRGGGPIRSISNMVDAIGGDVRFNIVTTDRDLGDSDAYPSLSLDRWSTQGKADVFYLSSKFGRVFRVASILRDRGKNVIALNSFFSFRFSIIPLLLCKLVAPNVVVILGPRGEFSMGALELKSFKKRAFVFFSKLFRLHRKVVWHASSDYEAADIRRVMGDAATIRVATDIAKPCENIVPALRLEDQPLRIVFVSRISRKKNLIGAIEILKNVKRRVVFDVYGPIEDEDYLNECNAAAESLSGDVVFRYCGVLKSSEVVAQLAKYDLFFFPTLGENFGHVIAEALSAGLPLLISDTTPWRNLVEKEIGWDLPLLRTNEFAACIDECSCKSPDEYDRWRKNIIRWAVRNVGNKDAIEQNRQLFSNLYCQK